MPQKGKTISLPELIDLQSKSCVLTATSPFSKFTEFKDFFWSYLHTSQRGTDQILRLRHVPICKFPWLVTTAKPAKEKWFFRDETSKLSLSPNNF